MSSNNIRKLFFPVVDLSTIGYIKLFPSDIRGLILKYNTGEILLNEFVDHLVLTYLPLYIYDISYLNIETFKKKIKNYIIETLDYPLDLYSLASRRATNHYRFFPGKNDNGWWHGR